MLIFTKKASLRQGAPRLTFLFPTVSLIKFAYLCMTIGYSLRGRG